MSCPFRQRQADDSGRGHDECKLIVRHFNYRTEPVPIFSDRELKNLTFPVMLNVGEQDGMLHSRKTVERLSIAKRQAG